MLITGRNQSLAVPYCLGRKSLPVMDGFAGAENTLLFSQSKTEHIRLQFILATFVHWRCYALKATCMYPENSFVFRSYFKIIQMSAVQGKN